MVLNFGGLLYVYRYCMPHFTCLDSLSFVIMLRVFRHICLNLLDYPHVITKFMITKVQFLALIWWYNAEI